MKIAFMCIALVALIAFASAETGFEEDTAPLMFSEVVPELELVENPNAHLHRANRAVEAAKRHLRNVNHQLKNVSNRCKKGNARHDRNKSRHARANERAWKGVLAAKQRFAEARKQVKEVHAKKKGLKPKHFPSSPCKPGRVEFNQPIEKGEVKDVDVIPKGSTGVTVTMSAPTDIDLELWDGVDSRIALIANPSYTNTKRLKTKHCPGKPGLAAECSGTLTTNEQGGPETQKGIWDQAKCKFCSESAKKKRFVIWNKCGNGRQHCIIDGNANTVKYAGVKIWFSGDDYEGHVTEKIKLTGTTNRNLALKVFGWKSGKAKVTYTYKADPREISKKNCEKNEAKMKSAEKREKINHKKLVKENASKIVWAKESKSKAKKKLKRARDAKRAAALNGRKAKGRARIHGARCKAMIKIHRGNRNNARRQHNEASTAERTAKSAEKAHKREVKAKERARKEERKMKERHSKEAINKERVQKEAAKESRNKLAADKAWRKKNVPVGYVCGSSNSRGGPPSWTNAGHSCGSPHKSIAQAAAACTRKGNCASFSLDTRASSTPCFFHSAQGRADNQGKHPRGRRWIQCKKKGQIPGYVCGSSNFRGGPPGWKPADNYCGSPHQTIAKAAATCSNNPHCASFNLDKHSSNTPCFFKRKHGRPDHQGSRNGRWIQCKKTTLPLGFVCGSSNSRHYPPSWTWQGSCGAYHQSVQSSAATCAANPHCRGFNIDRRNGAGGGWNAYSTPCWFKRVAQPDNPGDLTGKYLQCRKP